MSNELIVQNSQEIIQKLVLSGDISTMTQQQKVDYYSKFCNALGLNPLTQPFAIIKFQGKEKLYAQKDCTEQLRKIHGVSITDITTTSVNDVFIVTAKAQDKTGKTDCSTGAVNIKGLTGDNLANALMKAETKAKRRVTLSICGLGILDETETETIKGAITEDASFTELPGVAAAFDTPDSGERQLLIDLVYNSTLTESQKEKYLSEIPTVSNYKRYEKIKYGLENCQMEMEHVTNPSAKDINKRIKAITG